MKTFRTVNNVSIENLYLESRSYETAAKSVWESSFYSTRIHLVPAFSIVDMNLQFHIYIVKLKHVQRTVYIKESFKSIWKVLAGIKLSTICLEEFSIWKN